MPPAAAILRPRISLDIAPSSFGFVPGPWISLAEEPAGQKKRIEEFRSECEEKPKLYFLANLIVTKSARLMICDFQGQRGYPLQSPRPISQGRYCAAFPSAL